MKEIKCKNRRGFQQRTLRASGLQYQIKKYWGRVWGFAGALCYVQIRVEQQTQHFCNSASTLFSEQ